MRRIFFFLALISAQLAMAQSAGVVTYQIKDNLKKRIELSGKDMGGIELPEWSTSTMELTFKGQQSVYQSPSSGDEPSPMDMGGGKRVMIKMGGGNNILYTDHSAGVFVNQQDFMGKLFLISGELNTPAWKVSGEQMMIDGRLCMKATYTRKMDEKEEQIEAWFVPEIPVQHGPDQFSGLPGLIVKLTIDGDTRIYEATDIILEEVPSGTIEEPRKGKKVSQEEFEDIRRKKLEEMGASSGGGVKLHIIQGN